MKGDGTCNQLVGEYESFRSVNRIKASLPTIWPSVVVSDWGGLSCTTRTSATMGFPHDDKSIMWDFAHSNSFIPGRRAELNKPICRRGGKSVHLNHSIWQPLHTIDTLMCLGVNKSAQQWICMRKWTLAVLRSPFKILSSCITINLVDRHSK